MDILAIRLFVSLLSLAIFFLLLYVVVRAAIVSALRSVRRDHVQTNPAVFETNPGWPFK